MNQQSAKQRATGPARVAASKQNRRSGRKYGANGVRVVQAKRTERALLRPQKKIPAVAQSRPNRVKSSLAIEP